jgi:intron-binding protein aquarius
VGAIVAGVNPGLTMVVGPPGTGKTDVAVQIIANLYHNFPDQHTLLVTHSNQALNQLFEKIIALGNVIYLFTYVYIYNIFGDD